MSYPFNYPTPTNATVNIYTGQEQGTNYNYTWVKPTGCSFVWFTLIGSGGNGGAGSGAQKPGGGGSGAVTNCLVPAFLLPDELIVMVGGVGSAINTSICYQQKSTTVYLVLDAANGSSGTSSNSGAGGGAANLKRLGAAGLYQSIAGQAGVTGGSVTASATTFLSGGAGFNGATPGTVAANYGNSTTFQGFSAMQPIIVGVGGASDSTAGGGYGGVGCGGGGYVTGSTVNGRGGPGMAVIIAW